MLDRALSTGQTGSFTRRQQVFFRYMLMILVDLTVLNLFNEYWDRVQFDSFSISLMTAILLQLLLQLAVAAEHRVANYFKSKQGVMAKVLRALSTWFVLFVSKVIILKAISIFMGDQVSFIGRWHGVVPFVLVVITIIAAEQAVARLYRALA